MYVLLGLTFIGSDYGSGYLSFLTLVVRRRLSDVERERTFAHFNECLGVLEVGMRLGMTWFVIWRLFYRFNGAGTV